MAASEAAALRAALVETLKQKGDLSDPAIEAAFLVVPRHVFLPDVPLERAYANEAVAIKSDSDGTILTSASQPSMMALMLRQLRVRPGDNVLEIGAGTGYNAALLNALVGERGSVTAVEIDKEMAAQARENLQRAGIGGDVTIVDADGALGYAPRASYDRIIATAAVWDVPAAWVRQLKPDGVLVVPVGGTAQFSAAFVQHPQGGLYSATNLPCRFITLRGLAAGPATSALVPGSRLTLVSDHLAAIDLASVRQLLSDTPERTLISSGITVSDYWQGFLPYLEIHVPEDFILAGYVVGDNQQAFGMEGSGFAVLQRGSACFVPFDGSGEARSFGGGDAFFAIRDAFDQWEAAGRPGYDRLRMRLLPKDQPPAKPLDGRVFVRTDHHLYMWMDTRA